MPRQFLLSICTGFFDLRGEVWNEIYDLYQPADTISINQWMAKERAGEDQLDPISQAHRGTIIAREHHAYYYMNNTFVLNICLDKWAKDLFD
jgi:hypothetical protein